MFPRLKQRLGTVVLDRMDLLLELTTLGEYGFADDGLPVAIERAPCPGGAKSGGLPAAQSVRRRDACPLRGAPTPKICDQLPRP